MGKKNKNKKGGMEVAEELGMPRNVKREVLETCNILLDKCSKNFAGLPSSEEWSEFTEIHAIVSELRQKQQKYVMKMTKRGDAFSSFFTWLQQNGVDTNNVAVQEFPVGGYGLKATRNIQDQELFLRVPRKVIMSPETANESPLKNFIAEDRILQAMPNIVLALHVLCEKCTAQSSWAPYLNILPETYSTPLYFTMDEILLLKGSPAFSEIMNQFRNITRQYAYFYKLFQTSDKANSLPPHLKNFCFDDYKWAVSTVMTRQNQIPTPDGGRMINALIPLWDMCNHTNGEIMTDYSLDKDESQCYSLGHVQQDEQVFIFYGERSNADFLVHSGFVYPSNRCDRLAVKLGISKNDPLYGLKSEVLVRLSMLPSRLFSLHCGTDPVDSDMLAYLRVFSMNQQDLELMLRDRAALSSLRDFDVIYSKENEVKAWSFISTRAQLLLRAYPNNFKEDEDLLTGNTIGDHARMCIQLRLAEKRILQNSVEYAAAKAELAKMPQQKKQQTAEIMDAEIPPAVTDKKCDELNGIKEEIEPIKQGVVSAKEEIKSTEKEDDVSVIQSSVALNSEKEQNIDEKISLIQVVDG